ncbi:EamA family transporter [Halalkalibacillus halophilus]|uniref:EamA family transporter n=1 Tax=Halalkalibacillus halophilus TaxID=392827 RepID=UPI00041BD373|nr:DMT family transporter [Halalkalibacillus halophilus]
MRMNYLVAYSLVIVGAAFWGLTGLFVENLYAFGFTPWQVVTVRLTISSLILVTLITTFAKHYLKIKLKDLPFFIGIGVISIALFNWCYFEVMERSSVSVAVIFVYTSPIFAALIASVWFKEKLTLQKAIAIFITMIGCGLVIEFLPIGGLSLSVGTIILGFLAGLFCASYSIFGKFVSRRYHPLTITVYAMVCGTLFMFPTSSIWSQGEAFVHGEVWLNIFAISIISTIAAYILYTIGLTYIESSKATILASIELIVAVLVGVFVLNEILTGWQLVGIALVILSLCLTVFSFKNIIALLFKSRLER